jgi:predicted NUDIX family NTP pyrophosphohydrolase
MASRKSQSAGLLLFRERAADLEVLLGHPGGPFWRNKDDGAWSILKGLIGADEGPLSAARREFAEETGNDPEGVFLPLGEARQPGGKVVQAWAIEGDWDPALIRSNTFEMEWPPRVPDAIGPFRKSTERLGSLLPTRDGRSSWDRRFSLIDCLRLWQRDVRPEKRTEFVDENYVTCAGLSVQPAAVIQSMRPVVMYTIAPRCAPKT